MRTKLLRLSVVLVGLVAYAAAPAAAFHGAAYTARGTATNLATGDVYDAVVKWSGAFGLQGGTYTTELFDEDTGASVHKLAIPGRETLTNVHFLDGCVEYVDYVGQFALGVPMATHPAVGTVMSLVPNPVFKIVGWQLNNLCTGIANMHYEGNYLTVFDLVLDVWGPPGA